MKKVTMKYYPKSLFKYSKFSYYTIEMIRDGYLYCCPAYKLDDQFECLSNIARYENIDKSHDIETALNICNGIGIQIPGFDFKQAIDDKLNLNTEVIREYARENYLNITDNDIETVQVFYNSILTAQPTEEADEALKRLFLLQNYIGICSLAEENTNQVLWTMYANDYKGYCIEYDVEAGILKNQEITKDIYKVSYSENRDANLPEVILKTMMPALLKEIGIPGMDCDNKELKDALIKIVTTKYTDWSFQKEWRVIGKPKEHKVAFPIKAIYLGKKIAETEKEELIRVCKNNSIKVYEQYDDYESLKICFREI